MFVVALASQKGGSGKSTLCTNLAVAATRSKKRSMLFDLDPQRTAEQWFLTREHDEPSVATIDSNQLGEAIARARKAGIEWLFLDTAGRDAPSTAAAIRAADFCLVPCRPTPQDMKATPATVETIKRLEKPFAFVLTQTPVRGQRSAEASKGLSILGTVSPISIAARTAFQDASGAGLNVNEFEPDGKAAHEIKSLWRWLAKHVSKLSHG